VVSKTAPKLKLRVGKPSATLILALILLAGLTALLTVMTQKQSPPTTVTGTATTTSTKLLSY